MPSLEELRMGPQLKLTSPSSSITVSNLVLLPQSAQFFTIWLNYTVKPSCSAQNSALFAYVLLYSAAASLNQLHAPSSPVLNRSLSAPSKLDQSTTVQEGIHDVRRLQRWRTNVQKKHSRCSAEDQTDSDVNVRTFVSTVAEIFTFIGSDPDKAVSTEDP